MALIDVELSRRASKVQFESLAQRFDFVAAAEKAGTFSRLPAKYRNMILAAEGKVGGGDRRILKEKLGGVL